MKEYNFDFCTTKARGAARIDRLGITLNSDAARFFGKGEILEVGYDKENRAICIKRWEGKQNIPRHKLSASYYAGKVIQARINCKNFVKYISCKSGIDFIGHSKSFFPIIGKESGTIIINLEN